MVYSEEYTNLDGDNVFKEITYDEFMDMFEHLETGIVLLGGAWCKNAQIIVPYANTLAKSYFQGMKRIGLGKADSIKYLEGIDE